MYQLAPILMSETYMSENTKFMHHLVIDVANLSMYVLELLSVAIIVFTTVVAFVKLFRHESYARVYLLHGQSIGLTFKLGAEILRTVTATSLLDICEVFLLIVIKACMVLLIERELKSTHDEEDAAHGIVHVAQENGTAKKYKFSLFHTETQLASHSPEAEELQHEIDEIRSQMQQNASDSNAAGTDPVSAKD